MIKVNEGKVKIEGDVPLIMSEFSVLVKSLNEIEEIEEEWIRDNFEMGFMDEKELINKLLGTFKEFINKVEPKEKTKRKKKK